MAYKFKPNKSVAKRFRVSGTGKLKRGHSLTSHLMSGRSAKKRRQLRQPALVSEDHAPRLRKLMGIAHLQPKKTTHERAIQSKNAATE
jgi:large subunit ribosomal protein L35